jgi:hypothetical protein
MLALLLHANILDFNEHGADRRQPTAIGGSKVVPPEHNTAPALKPKV